MLSKLLNDDETKNQSFDSIKRKLLNLNSDDIKNINKIKEEEKETETIELFEEKEDEEEEKEDEEEEEEDYTISKENFSNSEMENSKIINKNKSRYELQKLMKKHVIIYKKCNKKTILKRKKYYVLQLLQRWWYALPPWPPDNYDTTEKLRNNKLRLVEEKNWKKEVEINSDNFKKCMELPGYKYVYITKEGKVFDFRPQEGKPSFNNLMKLNDIELHQYIVKALKNQLKELEKNNKYSEKILRNDINNQLKIATNNLLNLKRKK